MRNKKGFTLVELLAVIVVLGIILVIATTNVMKSINNSKEKTKFIAAKEIVEIASVYMYENNIESGCVEISTLVDDGYLETDVTNPKTGKNISNKSELVNQKVCVDNNSNEQDNYDVVDDEYSFDGYHYKLK